MDPRTTGLTYTIPDDSGVVVRRNESCRGPHGADLEFDVYLPAGAVPVPVVVFVHGDTTPERLRGAKDWAQFKSWGRLMAASGLAAVTFNRRSTEGGARIAEAEAEVESMLDHIHQQAAAYGLQPERVGVWVCSAGPPTIIPLLLQSRFEFVRCAVVYYGLMDIQTGAADAAPRPEDPAAGRAPDTARRYSALQVLQTISDTRGVPPMLLMRAGRDRPEFNQSIDRFMALALERGLPVELFNHPEGVHAFDVRNDVPRTREAVARTIEFFRWHLQP